MAGERNPNKAKIARRVVEVLEYFDEQGRGATVLDIARRYNRPQSSTSELLGALVEMGLLYKDLRSHTFTPTPRAALLGSMFQPGMVRDGRLSAAAERLRAETGLGAAVIGMVGLSAQVFRWNGGRQLAGGAQAPLHATAAGWLLLSTLSAERCDGILRRLRAEAPDDQRFCLSGVGEKVEACRRDSFAVGPAGYGAAAEICAVLLPRQPGEKPLALGLVFRPADRVQPAELLAVLRRAAEDCAGGPATQVVRLDDYRPQPRALGRL
jgi:DNA-binding IclR family transcriptional regulator